MLRLEYLLLVDGLEVQFFRMVAVSGSSETKRESEP